MQRPGVSRITVIGPFPDEKAARDRQFFGCRLRSELSLKEENRMTQKKNKFAVIVQTELSCVQTCSPLGCGG